jgi:hypothetical protein
MPYAAGALDDAADEAARGMRAFTKPTRVRTALM